MCMLRNFKILQYGSACHDAVFQMVYAESFQVLYAEMLLQFLSCCLLVEHPFVEFEHTMFCAEESLEVCFLASFKEHLLRLEVGNQLLNIVVGTFCGEEFSC